MKKRPIKSPEVVFTVAGEAAIFRVPREKAEGFLVLLNDYRDEELIPAEEVFRDLHQKYTKVGALLKGARLKEEMTQAELAKKLQITQGDLSKMEYGKRSIGKQMAKRLAKVLNTDYRIFL